MLEGVRLLDVGGGATFTHHAHFDHYDHSVSTRDDMSWALNEFFSAVEEEFGVPIGEADDQFLETPGAVIDFVVENSEASDGMDEEEYRDHIAGVVGEIMARTLGVTRYSEGSRFVLDLHVR
ncbi:MAG TPA: hypothetical protein VGM67_05935 [Gemmatimonadaceae bacterium]